MMGRRLLVVVAASTLFAAATSPGCSSTVEEPATASTEGAVAGTSTTGDATGAGGIGGSGTTTTTPATGGASTGGASAGGASAGGGGAGGGGMCALCSAAFQHTNPAPPSSLCTDNGPESSKQYYDAYEACCTTNCASKCDCAQPYALESGLCQLCQGQYCKAERNACGECDPCNSALQGNANLDRLCTAGSSPSSATLFATIRQCACGVCAQACANECMDNGFDDPCFACLQTSCPDDLAACAADATANSG
jgi:hypothetical protein